MGTPLVVNDEYPTGVDVNDDGLGYAITTDYVELPPDEEGDPDDIAIPTIAPDGAVLYSADANTGQLSGGVPVTLDFDDVFPTADECTAIDYTGGVVTAACIEYFEDDSENLFPVTYIGVLDPATGVLDPGEFGEGFLLYVTAIATDPISGQLYVFTIEPSEGFFTHGVYTLGAGGLESVTSTPEPVWGADFDRGGQLWVTTELPEDGNENPDYLASLATVDLGTGLFPFSAFYVNGPEDFWTEAITVWGKEVLPATGPANPVVPVTAAAIALLAGAILAGVTVLRRRSEDAA